MPSTIATVAEYHERLQDAITRMKVVTSRYPGDPQLSSILKQLEALQGWTVSGRPPSLEEQGRLNFGLLASKYLDSVDDDLAQLIYDIASFVTYWD
jgi:hypothetical protein